MQIYIYLLKHWIGTNLVVNGWVWDAEDAVNDVHIAIGLSNVGLNKGGVNSGSFDSDGLVACAICDHIKV